MKKSSCKVSDDGQTISCSMKEESTEQLVEDFEKPFVDEWNAEPWWYRLFLNKTHAERWYVSGRCQGVKEANAIFRTHSKEVAEIRARYKE